MSILKGVNSEYPEHCGKANKRWVLVGHRPDSVGVTPHPCCRAETRQSTHDGLHGVTVFGCLQASTPKTRARVHMRMYVHVHMYVFVDTNTIYLHSQVLKFIHRALGLHEDMKKV